MHYQAGFEERTVGFLIVSLVKLFVDKAGAVINVFTVMVVFTAGQRFFDAKKILK